MDTPVIMLAYASSAAVGLLLTAAFTPSINRTVASLIPDELASSWAMFIKFALFVISFSGGMPLRDQPNYVGFPTPAVTPPVQGEALNLVMKSIGGALTSGTVVLFVFFAATLTATMAGRVWAAVQKRRELEAKEAAERAEEAKQEKKQREEAAEKRANEAMTAKTEPSKTEPAKRQEPAATRPVPPRAAVPEPRKEPAK